MGGPLKVFSGSSNRQLAEQIAAHLDVSLAESKSLGDSQVTKFANKEINAKILCSVRETDVYVIQSGAGDVDVNDGLMELFIMINALKIASAKRVTAVLPYFPYSKQSKQKRRGAIPAKLIAQLLKVAGVDAVLCIDLHHMQMQGFFDMPMDNIKVTPLLTAFIAHTIPNYESCVVVAKNAGASKRAALIAKRLKLDFAMIFGEQTKFAEMLSEETLFGDDGSLAAAQSEIGKAAARSSVSAEEESRTKDSDAPGPDDSMISVAASVDLSASVDLTASMSKPRRRSGSRIGGGPGRSSTEFGDEEPEPGTSVIGDVTGRSCILADDLLDSAEPYIKAAKLLCDNGATSVTITATHGIFSNKAAQKLQDCSYIDMIIVSNSIPQDNAMEMCSKIRILDISFLVAESIRRLHNDESLEAVYPSLEPVPK